MNFEELQFGVSICKRRSTRDIDRNLIYPPNLEFIGFSLISLVGIYDTITERGEERDCPFKAFFTPLA